MKKIIFLFLLFCMVTNGYAQVDYNTIIESVKELSFPYVLKCKQIDFFREYKVDTTTLKNIFNFPSEEVGFVEYDYDQDNDVKTNIRKTPVYAHVLGKFNCSPMLQCLLVNVFINNDPLNAEKRYLCVFSKEGKLIDKIMVEYIEYSSSINKRVVIINSNQFHLCEYVANEDKTIDEKTGREKYNFYINASEKEYEISKDGAFVLKKTNVHPLKYDRYYDCDHEDDPMMKYIR